MYCHNWVNDLFFFLFVPGKYDRMSTSTEYTESFSTIPGITHVSALQNKVYINIECITKANMYIFLNIYIQNKQKQRAEFVQNISCNFCFVKYNESSILRARTEAQ